MGRLEGMVVHFHRPGGECVMSCGSAIRSDILAWEEKHSRAPWCCLAHGRERGGMPMPVSRDVMLPPRRDTTSVVARNASESRSRHGKKKSDPAQSCVNDGRPTSFSTPRPTPSGGDPDDDPPPRPPRGGRDRGPAGRPRDPCGSPGRSRPQALPSRTVSVPAGIIAASARSALDHVPAIPAVVLAEESPQSPSICSGRSTLPRGRPSSHRGPSGRRRGVG